MLKKTIRVKCNDPVNSDFVLTVSGHVNAYAKIRPQRIRYSVKLNETVSKTVTVTPSASFPFKVQGVSLRKHKEIPCDLVSTNAQYQITVQCPSDKPGSFNDTIVIKTDSGKVPEIKIPISGYVIKPPVKKGNAGDKKPDGSSK